MGRFDRLASKFLEPRGVARQLESGGTDIMIPRQGMKPFTVSGSNPDEALAAYQTLYGVETPKIAPSSATVSERLLKERNLSNAINPEEATQIIPPSFLKNMAAGAAIPTANEISPLGSIQSGIDYYKQNLEEPIAHSSEQLARKLVGGTTPLVGQDKQRFVDENAPIVGMGLNPTNYIPYVPEASLGADAFSKLRGYLRGK